MRETPKSILKILEAIKGMQQFCVVGHIRPDGDCIGSQQALTLALQSQGLNVCCWNQDPAPAKLKFMDGKGLLKVPETDRKFDCVIAVDAASYERLGTLTEHIQSRKLLINIDHHPSLNDHRFDENFINLNAAATGEMVYDFLVENKVIDDQIERSINAEVCY